MSQVTVGRWGKNLAIRFPADIAKSLGLHDGEHVQIETQDDAIVIRRTAPHVTLDRMFQGKRPEDWRTAYAHAFDWGPDVGREIVEE